MDISKNSKGPQNGFSLIECMIALVMTMIGVLATAGLMGVGIRLEVESRNATLANSLARAKIEQLQNYSPTSTERLVGGGLNSDVAGHYDTPNSGFRRRWLIETPATDATVPANTQRITVSIISDRPDVRIPSIQIRTLLSNS